MNIERLELLAYRAGARQPRVSAASNCFVLNFICLHGPREVRIEPHATDDDVTAVLTAAMKRA